MWKSVIALFNLLWAWVLAFLRTVDPNEKLRHVLPLLFDSKDVTDFTPPSPQLFSQIWGLYSAVLDPQFYGMENIPSDRPVLFVGYHALLALEYPLLLSHLYSEKGFFLRAAGDYFHKYLPHWPIFRYMGAFDGSREACEALMKAQKHIVIFPGGGREVLKRKSDQKYTLMWKERLGFARLAIKHGYSIVPFASYGTEDMVDIMFDIPLTPVLGREMFLPIVKPPPPDRIQRVYFSFGKEIKTEQFEGAFENLEICQKVRDEAKRSVEEQIDMLKAIREKDKDNLALPRLKKAFLKKFL